MADNFTLRVAIRYFSAKKVNKFVSFISGFSLLGVMLGVAAMIVVMAVMEGFHIELTSKMIGADGDISVFSKKEDKISDFDIVTKKISNFNFVKQIIPQIYEKALIVSGSDSSGVLVRGIKASDLNNKLLLIQNQLAGDITDIYKGYNIAVGRELAINLNLKIGDEISLICPGKMATILGNLPRKKTFKIVNVFATNMYDYDSASIIMSLESAQKLFSYKENQINLIEIHTSNPESAEYFSEEILSSFGDKFNVVSWYSKNAQFLNALKVERVAMFAILSLIILVAAFNIISSLFMLVNEKKKDIAILKTIGASKKQILFIFIINGSIIGFIGTTLGVILGISLANNIESVRKFLESFTNTNLFDAAIYFLYYLPSKIVPENVVLISSMSILLSVLSTIYPALKAANLDPAEALRNE